MSPSDSRPGAPRAPRPSRRSVGGPGEPQAGRRAGTQRRPSCLAIVGGALRRRGGYTLTEALATATVATIGFGALIQMQTTSLAGVREARDLGSATAAADHFVEMVRANSHLCVVPDGSPPCAFLPAQGDLTGTWTVYERPGSGGIMLPCAPGIFDAQAPGALDFGLASEFPDGLHQRFCVHYRTSWIIPERLFRLDVRVTWPLAETDIQAYTTCPLTLTEPSPGQPPTVGHTTVSAAIAREGL